MKEIKITIRQDQYESLCYAAKENKISLSELIEGLLDHLQELAYEDYLDEQKEQQEEST